MKLEDLKTGMLVQIKPQHPSGYGGRMGLILDIGTFELLSGGSLTRGIVDIGEAGLLIVEPEALLQIEPDPLPPGWGEFNV